jgi:oxygen-independent coproporphyrinogen-3 oxidase
VADLAAYRALIAEGRPPVSTVESLSRRQAMVEALLVGLRLTEGLDKRAFTRRFGVSFAEAAAGALAPLLDGGLVIEDDARVRTTRRGRELLDSVIAHLGEAMVTE